MVTNKVDEQLQKIKREERIGLMTHVVVGYPSLAATRQLVQTMADSGVDFVELQLPFSDPLADGPTIQKACETSLTKGTKVADAFAIAAQLSQEVAIPLLFMAYFNTVYKYGVERFCADAKKAGITGLIVPDVPMEAAEHEGFLEACKQHDLHYIITLAPTSSIERLEKNVKVASGFAYCMTRAGTTGARQTLDPNLVDYFNLVRKYIKVPLAAGFGIRDRTHIEALSSYADVAVVGSALLDVVTNASSLNMKKEVRKFLDDLIA